MSKVQIEPLPAALRSYLRTGVAITSVTQCVEELVLNSVDANATCIAVRVDLGCFKVQVVDNGEGIPHDELDKLGNRFCTSKCHTIADINNLCHYGYRGEAIASIVNCCGTLEITTRSKLDGKTYSKTFTNGKAAKICPASNIRPSIGTTMTVNQLFINYPVRQKSLNLNLELGRLRETLEGIALIKPGISFSLRNDATGQVILSTKRCPNISRTFSQLYGTTKADALVEINGSSKIFRIHGYIGRDGHQRKNLQFVYVNGRLVKKSKIHKLLKKILMNLPSLKPKLRPLSKSPNPSAVKPLFSTPPKFSEAFPVYVLEIKCPISEYDITFDPAKTMVEFKDWDTLLNCVSEVTENFVKSENVVLQLSQSPVKTTAKVDENQTDDAQIIATDNLKDVLVSKAAKRAVKENNVVNSKSSPSKSEKVTASDSKALEETDVFKTPRNKSTIICPTAVGLGKRGIVKETPAGHETSTSDESISDTSSMSSIDDTTVKNSEVKTGESNNLSALNNDTSDSLDRTKQGLKRVESSNPGIVCSLSSYKKRLGKTTHDPQDISVDESLQKLQKIFPSSDILHPNRIVSSLQKFRSKFARKENSYNGIGHANSTGHTLERCNQDLGPVGAASNAYDKIERNSANDIEAFVDDFNYQNGGLSQYSIQATIHVGDDRESHTSDLTDKATCVSDIQNQRHGHMESQNSNFIDKANRFNNQFGPMNEYRRQHNEAGKAFRSEMHLPILHEAHNEQRNADVLNVSNKTNDRLNKVSGIGPFRNENYGQKHGSRNQHTQLEGTFRCQMSTTHIEHSATNMRDIHDPTMTNIIYFDDFSKNKCGPIKINRQQNYQSEKFSPNHAKIMPTEHSVYSPNYVNRACFKDGNQSNRNAKNEENMLNDKKHQYLSTHNKIRTYPDVYNSARMAGDIGVNNCSNTGDDEILYATKLYPEQVHPLGKRSGGDVNSPEIMRKKQCIDLTSPVIDNDGKHVPICHLVAANNYEANHLTTECPDIDNGQKVESAESDSDFVITECNIDHQEDLSFISNAQLPKVCDNTNTNCDSLYEIGRQMINITVQKDCDMNNEKNDMVDMTVESEFKIKYKEPVADNEMTAVSYYERKSKESVIENDIVFECTETRAVVSEDETEITDGNDANDELNVTQAFTPHLDQELGEDEKAEDSPLASDEEKKIITPESLGFSPKAQHLETSDSPRSIGFEIARDLNKPDEKMVNESSVSCMDTNAVKTTDASNTQVENVTYVGETAADHLETNAENNDSEDIDKVIDNLYNLFEAVPESSVSKEIQSPKPSSGDTPMETIQSEVSLAAADDSTARNSLFQKSNSAESLNPKCDSVSITQLLKSPTQSGSHLDAGQIYKNETCNYSQFSDKPGFSGTDLFDVTPTCSNPIMIDTPSLDFAIPNDVNKDTADLRDTSDTNDAIKGIGNTNIPEPDSATVGANEMCKTADEDVEMNYEDAVKFVDKSCDKCEEINESSEVLWSDCSWDPSQVMAGQVGKEDDTTNAMSGIIESGLSLLKDSGNSFKSELESQRGMSDIMETGLRVLPESGNGQSVLQETDTDGGSVLHDTGNDPVVLRKSSGLQQSENGLNGLHQTGNGPSGLQRTQSGCSLLPETGSGHYVLPDTYDEKIDSGHNENVSVVDNVVDDGNNVDTGCQKCGHETDEKDSKTDAVINGQSDLEAWFKNLEVITNKPCTSNVLQTDKPSDVVKKMHACRFSKNSLKSVKVLGQVDKKFIACLIDTESDFELETDDKLMMILVDQHAAHERIRLEILTEDAFEDGSRCGKLAAYKVDQPRYLNFTEQEVRTITNFKDNYLKLGIDFEKKSCTCLLIKTIPESLVYKEKSRIYWNTIQVLMREYLSVFMSTTATSGVLPQTIHKVLCSLACHGAIKFGDKLSDEECVKLINDLSLCDLPFQCAHGRPSVMPLLNMERLKPLSYKKDQRKPNLQKLKRKMMT